MVEVARKVIVVTDSSKIGVIGLATIMPVNMINKVITDHEAPMEFVRGLEEQGVEVILV